MGVVELNEAFASQVIACAEELGVDWRDEARSTRTAAPSRSGHPLGASGARLAGTAALQLQRTRRALRAGHHVHRRRPGHRHDPGAHRCGVNSEEL